MKKKYVYTFIICTAAFFISEAGIKYSAQPPFNYTGADGSTCSQCHGNFNNGGGTISTFGLPSSYIEGQQYDFSITLSHPSTRGRWGFSIAARDANNQAVGTFTETNPNAALNGTELSHFMAAFQTGTTFTYGSLRWTAPVNPTTAQKTVKFSYIGNAANGDGGNTGDFIYNGSINSTWIPTHQPPVVGITSPANNSTLPAGSIITLNATASDPNGTVSKVEFYNNGIKFLTDSTAPYGLVSGNDIEPGNYVLTAKAVDNSGDSTVSDTVRLTVTGCTPTGVATGEGYVNIPGTQVADLLNNAAYPNNAGITAQLNSLEYSSVGDNYGSRLRGYICAPQTGNYTFYIAGDDQAGLFLSTDADPAHKVLIAYNETPVSFRNWTRFATQKSASIKLVRGVRYYFETLHKQSTGTNHLSVGWVMPNGVAELPIKGNRLSPAESGSRIVQQSFREAMQEKQLSAALRLTVKVAPNPSNSYFTIHIGSNSDARISLLLTDVLGRIVERRTTISANGTLQLGHHLRPGIYFLEVTQGTHKERLKLVRE